jgi:hypothetical protein
MKTIELIQPLVSAFCFYAFFSFFFITILDKLSKIIEELKKKN